MEARITVGKMKYLLTALAAVSLQACASIDEYYDKTIYKITEYECKMFDAEKFGKCMREHYPRVEEDYSWESEKN
jgi:hypothetical protein